MPNSKVSVFVQVGLVGLTVFCLFANSSPLRGQESSKVEVSKGVSVPVPEQGKGFLSGSVGETIQTAFLLTFAASVVKSLNGKKKPEEGD